MFLFPRLLWFFPSLCIGTGIVVGFVITDDGWEGMACWVAGWEWCTGTKGSIWWGWTYTDEDDGIPVPVTTLLGCCPQCDEGRAVESLLL